MRGKCKVKESKEREEMKLATRALGPALPLPMTWNQIDAFAASPAMSERHDWLSGGARPPRPLLAGPRPKDISVPRRRTKTYDANVSTL